MWREHRKASKNRHVVVLIPKEGHSVDGTGTSEGCPGFTPFSYSFIRP